MRLCLQTFDAGIKELRAYLESIDDEDQLLRSLAKTERQDKLTVTEQQLLSSVLAAHIGRKQYIYSVAIVSLYGLLERFVDSVVEAYVHRAASLVTSYKALPEAIVSRHTQLSLDLAKAITEERYRSGGTTEAQVIENLHLCLSGAPSFRMNAAAFVLHRGNVYLGKITDFLTAVGIDGHLRRVSQASEMLNFLQVKYPDRKIPLVADQDIPALFEPIDSLVSRRNEIAHGVINIEDIESIDLLNARCDFLLAYVHALYRVVLQEVIRLQVQKPDCKALGKPIQVFDHCIVCFEIKDGRVRVGDIIAAATNAALEPFRFSRIEGLQVNRAAQIEVIATEPTKFGAKVKFHANENYDYFLFADETL